jgi:hypothetical protein
VRDLVACEGSAMVAIGTEVCGVAYRQCGVVWARLNGNDNSVVVVVIVSPWSTRLWGCKGVLCTHGAEWGLPGGYLLPAPPILPSLLLSPLLSTFLSLALAVPSQICKTDQLDRVLLSREATGWDRAWVPPKGYGKASDVRASVNLLSCGWGGGAGGGGA